MNTTLFGLIIFVLCVCLFITFELKKRKTFATLVHLLNHGEYGEYLLLLNTSFAKFIYPRYNHAYMRLNAYMFMEDHGEIMRLLEEMLAMKTSKKQRIDLVTKAFNYYIEQEDKAHAQPLLEEINTFDNELLKKESRTIFDIFILKKYSYIEEMEKQLIDAKDIEKGFLEYLLSLQYENKKDIHKSNEYLKLSQMHIALDK